MGKHSRGCLDVVAYAVLVVALLAGCGPRKEQPNQVGVHEGDTCQQLGRERLDVTGHAVRRVKDPGEARATWKRLR